MLRLAGQAPSRFRPLSSNVRPRSALPSISTLISPTPQMIRIFTSLATATLLSACATQAPSQGYRPAGYSGAPWTITGAVNLLSGSATFDINSQRVIDGRLNLLTGDGEFSGSYQGRPVNASCITKMGFVSNVTTCFVFVAGEKAATLTF